MQINYRFTVIFLLCLVTVPVLPITGRAAGPDPQKVSAVLTAGGGAVGGIGFMTMTGLSKVVRDSYPKIDISVIPGGWVGNLFRVNAGEMDIGSTTTAMCALAAQKIAPFDKPLPNLRSLYSTQDKLFYFALVTAETPANSLQEVFEKKAPLKLCTIQKGTTTELMWRAVFESQNVTWEKLASWGGKMNFVAWSDAVSLVKDGHADGILAVGTGQMGWVMELVNARNMKILKWDAALLDRLHQKFGFGQDTIPANNYTGITEAHVCPTDMGSVVVNADMPAEVVEAILTAVADREADYRTHHKALENFSAMGMADSLRLPIHPAALNFYKERHIPLK